MSRERLPLHEEHASAGAVFGEVGGTQLPRHYGDPSAEYEAAVGAVAVVDRCHRRRLRVTGRSPFEMLNGILTCTLPRPLAEVEEGVLGGRGYYGLVLTPKGKIVSDLRAYARGPDPDDGLLLDVPAEGSGDLDAYFAKYLPPRFAAREDISGDTGMLTVLGPGAPELLSRLALALRVDAHTLASLDEGELRVMGTQMDQGVAVARTDDVATPAFDLVGDTHTVRGLWKQLAKAGAAPAGRGVWETLRLERGRPAFGSDMDVDTIPVEAGLAERAIDHGKGCYTGQEVIVRIRDRGRVNWHLRGLLLGDAPSPAAGSELFGEDGERVLGRVRSSAHSPRMGQTVALGYVRREVEPPAELRLGGPGGPAVGVRGLGEGGWQGV